MLGVQSLGLWTTREVPDSFFRMKKGGHSSLNTRNWYSRELLSPVNRLETEAGRVPVTSPRPPVGARQSGQRTAPQLTGAGGPGPRAAASRDARPRPSISVTAFFPGSSLLALWTVAKEVCARGQKEDFLWRRQGANGAAVYRTLAACPPR